MQISLKIDFLYKECNDLIVEETQNPIQQQTINPVAPEKPTEAKPKLPKKILVAVLGIVIIVACIAYGVLNYKNFISNCAVVWASVPSALYPSTNYTIYINKVSTSHAWRDVSVYKDLDKQNSNAYRESGLTGDAYNQPTNTYTLTFNSAEVGTHKLYFYNNDFKAYGESAGTGPRTLCTSVLTYETSNTAPTPTVTPAPTVNASLLGSIFWNVASSSATSDNVLNDIKKAFSTFNTNGDFLGVESINISTIYANFAIAGMSKRDKDNNIIPTDGFEFLLYKNNLTWEILSSNNSSFCSTLKLAPADILNDSRKSFYIGCFPK